jgi:hypothetical protein
VQRLQRLGDREAVHDDELLGERLAEAHVHGALDLALEQGRVDRAADVVRRDHLLDPALRVEQDDLRRPAVGEVGDRLGRVVGRRPVDQDLAQELAAGELLERVLLHCLFELARGVDDGVAAQHRPRDAVVMPVSSSRSVSTSTRIVSAGTPSCSHAIWRRTVCTPWPISVQEWNSVIVPSASGRRIARPCSGTPLPMPVFFRPHAIPANGASR